MRNELRGSLALGSPKHLLLFDAFDAKDARKAVEVYLPILCELYLRLGCCAHALALSHGFSAWIHQIRQRLGGRNIAFENATALLKPPAIIFTAAVALMLLRASGKAIGFVELV